MFKIAYIIVTYNGENYIERCISSVRKFHEDSFIVVVDNNSQDSTLNIVKDLKVDEIIESNVNLGFGKANNLALRYAVENNFDYCFLLNQDVYFLEGDYLGFLRISENAFNQNFAIVSPLHMAPNEREFDFKFNNYISNKNTPNLLKSIKKNKNLNTVFESRTVNAAAWFLSIETLFEVGVFDPLFLHYGEDTDYIQRVNFFNMKIGVIPNFRIVHNRFQKESCKLINIKNKMKIWCISYLKNINMKLIYLVMKFPIELLFRVKKLNCNNLNKVTFFCSIIYFSVYNLNKVIKHRIISKKTKAFLN